MRTQKKTRSRQKELYRVGNWSEYDRALVQRGSLTVWIADGFEKTWFYQGPLQRGSQFEYSAQAIEVMLTLKNVFHLPNRATEGFACSLFGLLKIALPVPDHTTLSRRGKTLKVRLPRRASGHLDIVMDSTGSRSTVKENGKCEPMANRSGESGGNSISLWIATAAKFKPPN